MNGYTGMTFRMVISYSELGLKLLIEQNHTLMRFDCRCKKLLVVILKYICKFSLFSN